MFCLISSAAGDWCSDTCCAQQHGAMSFASSCLASRSRACGSAAATASHNPIVICISEPMGWSLRSPGASVATPPGGNSEFTASEAIHSSPPSRGFGSRSSSRRFAKACLAVAATNRRALAAKAGHQQASGFKQLDQLRLDHLPHRVPGEGGHSERAGAAVSDLTAAARAQSRRPGSVSVAGSSPRHDRGHALAPFGVRQRQPPRSRRWRDALGERPRSRAPTLFRRRS